MVPIRLLSSLSLCLLLCAGPASARQALRGTWSAELEGREASLVLTDASQRLTLGTRLRHAALQGLPCPLRKGPVHLTLVREAGTVHLEGEVKGSRAQGRYRFAPRSGFEAEMAALGYPGLSERERLQLALFDVGPTRLRALAALGYRDIPRERLVAVGLHGISPESIHALEALGLGGLSLETLLALAENGVSASFIAELEASGYHGLSPGQLSALRRHGVDARRLRELEVPTRPPQAPAQDG